MYEPFSQACADYLNETSAKAGEDRRHGTICHLSLAISLREFRDQVKLRLHLFFHSLVISTM